MKIVVDVGVGKAVERWLASQNLDVVAVRDLDPGMADIAILALAAAEQRLVITMDKDFGELIVRSGQLHAGVLLLRLADADSQEKLRGRPANVRAAPQRATGKHCIYHKDKLRIRQLP